MVEQSEAQLDLIFHALSDRTRRQMLTQLSRKECSISELAEPHRQSFAGISKHLKVLEAAHFIERTKEGRTFRCRANLAPLSEIEALLNQLGSYWRTQLDSLDRFFNQQNNQKEQHYVTRTETKRASKSRRKKSNKRLA